MCAPLTALGFTHKTTPQSWSLTTKRTAPMIEQTITTSNRSRNLTGDGIFAFVS
jgi:hypothetical protein